MADIKSPRLLYAKASLLLFLGVFAAVLLLVEAPSWRVAALFIISVWAFCRTYYFAFYVIQQYVDPNFRFAGLGAFVAYAWKSKFNSPDQTTTQQLKTQTESAES